MNQEHEDRQLDEAYRRASAADATRPDAKTRAAILAEAAAAARQRQPAANDARYLLRAIGGVAVIGVALLIWRQTDYRPPGEPAPFAVESLQREAPASASAPQLDTESAPQTRQSAPARDAANVGARADTGQSAQDASASGSAAEQTADIPTHSSLTTLAEPPTTQPAAPQPSAESRDRAAAAVAPEQDEAALEEVTVTGSRVLRPRVVGPRGTVIPQQRNETAPPRAAQSQTLEPLELLRRNFPTQYQSDRPHRLWLVIDRDGERRGGGELDRGQPLPELAAMSAEEAAAGGARGWQVHQLTNARGQAVELAIATVAQ